MLRRILPLALVAALAGGCGPAPEPLSTPTPTPTAVGPRCRGAADLGGQAVAFGPNHDLAGLMFGSTSVPPPGVGIVFAHEADDTACSWMRTAAAYAQKGYRTLIFDFAGFGASPQHAATYDQDVAAAAELLRTQGAERIVLIGASMGATAVVVAASEISPPVAGVVALSAPLAYGPMGALGVTLPPSMPVLLMAGSMDGEFPSDARTLHTSFGPGDYRGLVIVDSSSLHGFRLVAVDAAAPLQSKTALEDFLARFAPIGS